MGVDNKPLLSQLAGLPATPENGQAFYQYFFQHYPDVKQYFKGHESQDPAKIPGDAYFQKQGQNVINKLNELATASADDAKFAAVMDSFCVAHVKRGIPKAAFGAVPALLSGFLKHVGVTPAPQWNDFCAAFGKQIDAGYAKHG